MQKHLKDVCVSNFLFLIFIKISNCTDSFLDSFVLAYFRCMNVSLVAACLNQIHYFRCPKLKIYNAFFVSPFASFSAYYQRASVDVNLLVMTKYTFSLLLRGAVSFNFPVGGDINLRGFSDTRGALISNYWGLFTHAMSHYSSKLHTCVHVQRWKDGRTA